MKVCCDTEGRELTDERRYAPTSVPLRRKPCSRSPETLFHFTGIPILVVHPPRDLPMAWGPFFSSPRAVGMDLDDGAVQRHRLQLDADQLGALQVFEDPVEHPVLGPTIHTGVDRVPVPKALRQPSPLAPLLGDVQDRVEHLQIGHADIATLSREAGLDACVLRLGELHPANDITNRPIVLTGPSRNDIRRLWRGPGRGSGRRLATAQNRTRSAGQSGRAEAGRGRDDALVLRHTSRARTCRGRRESRELQAMVCRGVQPLASLVQAELADKLDTPDLRLDFASLAASDVHGRARAWRSLVGRDAVMDEREARRLVGLNG